MCAVAIGHSAALDVEKVKQKWMSWANATIEEEKSKLFKEFDIPAEIIQLWETNKIKEILPDLGAFLDTQISQQILEVEQNKEDKIFKLAQFIFSPECKNIKIRRFN